MSHEPRANPSMGEQALSEFLADLAARRSVPGGGAAAASALGHAAALGGMVIAFSRGKKRFEEHDAMLVEIAGTLETMRSQAMRLADEDARGFERLAALWPLDPDDPARREHWEDAVLGAVSPPRTVVSLALETLTALSRLVGRSSRLLRSDLAIAGRFAVVAAEAAAWNVEVNLDALAALPGREDEAKELADRTEAAIKRARGLADEIDTTCRQDRQRTITPE